jgi:hypothetical protein
MRRVSIVLAVLATTLAGSGPLAQAQESSASQAQESSAPQAQAQGSGVPQAQAQKGPTLGGHIGFVLPLVTHSGGQTTSLGDAPAVGFPTGITVKGSGPMAFDFEFVPQYNATGTRQTTLTLHPGLIYGLGHGWAVGLRAAFVVDQPTVGFTPLLNKSFPIKHRNGGLLKAYFVEADLPVRFSRPAGAPATNAVTFATHFGVSF